MNRSELVKQAREAGQAAGYNLQLIAREPERMNSPEKLVDGIVYLNTLIRFAESEIEMKKDRRPGQSRLRTRLKLLVASILADERRNDKGEPA